MKLLYLQCISSRYLNALGRMVDCMLNELASSIKVNMLRIFIVEVLNNILDAIVTNAVKKETLHVSALRIPAYTLLVLLVVNE